MPFVDINGWEFALIAVLFLVLFGPERLPEIAAQVGKLVREVRRASQTATGEIMREFEAAARESGTSTEEVRDVARAAQRTLQDTRKSLTGAVATLAAPVKDAATGVKDALDAGKGARDEIDAAVRTASDAARSANVVEGRPAGGEVDAAPDTDAAPEPAAAIDVEMLARRIAPFDLGEPKESSPVRPGEE